jgi:hypothetical protein
MVSDKFQTLNIKKMIFERNNKKDYFDLETARVDKKSKNKSMPTFLRDGIEVE